MHTVAIIGAGFTGTMVAVNLLRVARVKTRILLVERSGRFTAGVAYGTRVDEHSLNVPAGRMSAFPSDSEHFLRWAQLRNPSITGGTFVPRRLYGKYLAELLDDAEASSAPTTSVMRLASEARAVERQPDGGLRIVLADGRSFATDAVVLAIGNYEPSDPPANGSEFYDTVRYARDPWATGALDVGVDEPVLLLGSGLTMLDVAVALQTRGHRGQIHALSRRGLTPQPHRESASAPAHHDRPHTLASWPSTASGLLRELRREVREAESHGVDWREVVTSIRHDTQALWQSLSREERVRFLRHLRSYWETHRHRAAPSTSARIEVMRASGQLAVHAARLVSYVTSANGVCVAFRRRGAATEQAVRL
ncbi:MAG: FAD/NAD(P)-binding protein [bacterium]